MDKENMTLEEKADCWAYLLLQLGYTMGWVSPLDPNFNDSKFLEAKRKKYIEKYKK